MTSAGQVGHLGLRGPASLPLGSLCNLVVLALLGRRCGLRWLVVGLKEAVFI